jgi:hypothetical protein
MRRARLVIACALLATGCAKKPPVAPQAIDPDANSGADAKRTGAVAIPVNQAVTDEVNFDRQDQTDWKSIDLKGRAGILSVELHWDNANSDMSVDVFDALGVQIGASPDAAAGTQLKKVAVNIEAPGIYYLRVRAPKAKDGSVYNLIAKWDGAPVEVAEKEEPKARAHSAKPHAPKTKKWNGEGGVQGRIVSSYHEAGALILHLDKGSSANIKVGQVGTILEGPSGETPLDGGSFVVTQVIDEARSIGKCSLHSIGHNTRVAINTGGK